MRVLSLLSLLTFSLYQLGCAPIRLTATVDSPPPLQLEDRVLVPSPDTLIIDKDYEAVGTGAGAKSGAAGGVAVGAGVGLELGLESGLILFPPAAVVLVGGGAIIGGTLGATVGAVTATEASKPDCVTAKLANALEVVQPNSLLVNQLHQRLQEFSDREIPISEEMNDQGNALYPKIVSVKIDSESFGSSLTIIHIKSTILRRMSNGEVKSFGNIDLPLGIKSLDEWCALDDGELLESLRQAVITLSMRMSDRLLVQEHLDVLSTSDCPAYRGLRPITPPLTANVLGGVNNTPVDSLNPVLSWETFPRPVDIEKDPAISSKVENVVYDLVVRQLRDKDRSESPKVYSRVGLKNPTHRIEETLASGTAYEWTVRPRFLLNGTRRAISWGEVTYDTCPLAGHYESRYFFETPKPKQTFMKD